MTPTGQPLRRLVPADVPAIEALIAQGGPYAPDGFAPYQVEDGFFFGVEDGAGGLAAVGGTHILNREEGVAAIGNVYIPRLWPFSMKQNWGNKEEIRRM